MKLNNGFHEANIGIAIKSKLRGTHLGVFFMRLTQSVESTFPPVSDFRAWKATLPHH